MFLIITSISNYFWQCQQRLYSVIFYLTVFMIEWNLTNKKMQMRKAFTFSGTHMVHRDGVVFNVNKFVYVTSMSYRVMKTKI
jgi:hypothetical protein